MPFSIVRQDITKMKADAVVNAANTALQMGGGVCGAIFKAAGAEKLQQACDKVSPIKTGEAAITPGSVCKKCHTIQGNGEGLPRAAAPELNYPIQKMYHCGKCGETTVVRLEIIQ